MKKAERRKKGEAGKATGLPRSNRGGLLLLACGWRRAENENTGVSKDEKEETGADQDEMADTLRGATIETKRAITSYVLGYLRGTQSIDFF